jgi:hypothetical protein
MLDRVPMRLTVRIPQAVAGVCAVAAFAAACAGAARAAILPTLYVNYTTNCTFTLTDDSGKAVFSIAPGDYQVQLSEPQALIANGTPGQAGPSCQGLAAFSLTGPGVTIQTALDNGDGVNLFNESFQPSSTYVAVDNNNPVVSRITFTTTASGAAATPSVPYSTSTSSKGTTSNTSIAGSASTAKKSSSAGSGAALVQRGTLDATVSASGAPKLTFDGKGVTTLKEGRYKIAVVDASAKGGFIIQEVRRPAITVAGVSYTGRRSTTLELEPGQWFFYPTFVGRKIYFLVTA